MQNPVDLTGRVAVVTGAASGIGHATVRTLARHGARVCAADFDPVADTSAEYRELGIIERRCDVRLAEQLQALIDGVVEEWGRIDILVNNAGIGMVKQITEVTEADWDSCIDTNLKGPFFGCKYAISHMQRTGGGAIVNMASNAGLLPRAHDPVYSISKQALVGLTRSLALCHAHDAIRVNAICPGPVGDTRMMNADLAAAADPAALQQKMIDASPMAHALGRMISPDEVAAAVLYLVSDAASMVTGTALALDGGKSLGVPPKS